MTCTCAKRKKMCVYIYKHMSNLVTPYIAPLAAPGWLRRETGGYDYPL